MQSRRHQRVRELLIRAIGEVIRKEFSIEEGGLITVNDVGLSGDLHSAVVFVSVLGNPEQQRKGFHLLQNHRKHIQTIVAGSVVLKYTPQMRFELDGSVERGNRVMSIIEELDQSSEAE